MQKPTRHSTSLWRVCVIHEQIVYERRQPCRTIPSSPSKISCLTTIRMSLSSVPNNSKPRHVLNCWFCLPPSISIMSKMSTQAISPFLPPTLKQCFHQASLWLGKTSMRKASCVRLPDSSQIATPRQSSIQFTPVGFAVSK